MTVQRPPPIPDDPRMADPCTTSVQAPVADSVLAGAALVGAYVAMIVAMVDSTDSCYGQTGSCTTHVDVAPALGLLGAGAVFGSSAVYGFVGTHGCKRRVSLGARCASGNLAACRKVVPGWTPPPTLLAPRSAPPPGAPTAPPPPGAQDPQWVDVPPPSATTPPPTDARTPPLPDPR
jgi:hypothetical protein